MARRLLVLLVPCALLLGACSSDDSPAVQPSGTTSTSAATSSSTAGGSSTTASGTGTTAPGGGASTTTPSGPGLPMKGGRGTGTVTYSLAPERSEFCYRITVKGLSKATAAHLHRGGPQSAGDVVLNLVPPGDDGSVNTCSAADTLLIDEIQSSPASFYVDVHANDGVVRAQLR
jgi:hypothetical protein